MLVNAEDSEIEIRLESMQDEVPTSNAADLLKDADGILVPWWLWRSWN